MSADAPPPPFELDGPLPSGVTVLEASAGTGKTYAIATLAARYVAEGTPLERMLLVTFTRMATGELRERVRERLAEVGRGLAAGGSEDPVVALLARGPQAEVDRRRARLARALADFDAATIATTHSFCQEVLGGLGIAADLEPDVAFVEDLSDLVEEVLDDVYLRMRVFHRPDRPLFGRSQALKVARMAIENPGAPIVPAHGDLGKLRVRLGHEARHELEVRKRRLSIMSYDDLLARLQAALSGPGGAGTAARLRARFEVVLIDEFQDTDPIQWDIVRRAFECPACTLVLIADPKQAIYAFRGADVYSYLEAARDAAKRTLGTNRRSDQPLLDAFDALFGNARLGHPEILYRQVSAAKEHATAGLSAAPENAPMRIRLLDRTDAGLTGRGFAVTGAARALIARDLAGDLVRLLSSAASVRTADGGREAIRPGHLAVLVGTNRGAALIRQALEDASVPAVINGAGSVFATESARDWMGLLEALERPSSVTRAHAAALTPFLGWSAAEVAGAGEEEWESVHRRLHEWARVLRTRGIASLLETVTTAEGLPARLLARTEGERRLTDLRHVGQLMHVAASSEQLGVTALAGWLRRRIADAEADTSDEERSRRLESDAEAVQVLTVHRSKGLEFPVVYLPFLWEPGYIPRNEPVTFHDPDAGDRRAIDVALEGHAYRAHCQQNLDEQRGEDLRLAYVALTRARHQVVLWWAGSFDSGRSPLTRLVFGRQPDGTVASEGSTPTDARAREAFATLAARARDRVSVERADPGQPRTFSPAAPRRSGLATATFERELDGRWRRTSYSDITAAAHDARVGSEPEQPTLTDEPDLPLTAATFAAPAPDAALATPSRLEALPVGVRAGTLVHQALELADFAAAELDGELARALAAAPGRRAVTLADEAAVAAGLRAALETPLGPLFDGRALRDITPGDRLDELAFELPLAGGERPTATVTVAAIAAALRDALAPGDPLRAYAERLDDPTLRRAVRGYLTGSLDLVVRLPGPRFAVLDYKTNWLGEPDEPLTAWHYRPAALVSEMHERHYGLQALLYLVALHRYLRWRLPGYEPARHLAGVFYLFVRGMTGRSTPVLDGERCGVFAWRPSADLVTRLSDVLDGGAR